MENKNLNFKYLDHIDALRAISVILVIFFHINSKYFSLGYLGVDVFFVISGYVITNSIYDQQLNKNKSIFFFYVKRIKRIYPILLLVILTFLLSYVIVSPLSGNTNFFLESAVAALAGLSNLYFINNEVNYFLNESINPLLHTWSLGVEEQFYFIYPILIVFIFKLFKQNIEKIFLCIFLFILSSFLIYYFNTGIIGNFFSPIARFWEIGLGCLAFFYPSIKEKYKKTLNIFFVVVLIVTIFNFENEKIIHNTNLLVTLITFFLIINFRGIENTEGNLIIKKTYLPYLGKLSYSLYLWHLPVLYYCEIYFSGIKFYFIFIIISLTLSVCSFHFFENPLRKSQNMEVFVEKFIKLLPIVGLVFIFVIYSEKKIDTEKIYNNLKAFNYPEKKLKKYLKRLDHRHFNYLTAKCDHGNNLLHCKKDNNYNYSLYLTGDSHANHFLPAVDSVKFVNSYFFNNFAQCEIILKSFFYKNQFDGINNCKNEFGKNHEKIILKNLNSFKNKTVIVSLRLSVYLNPNWKIKKKLKSKNKLNKIKILKENYNKFISMFPETKIILVTTVPESKMHTEQCIFNEYLRKKMNTVVFNKCHFKKLKDKNRYNLVKNILKEISLNQKNVFIYDPYPLLCPSEVCHNYNEKEDFFMLHDKDHLSIEASKFISRDLSYFLESNL